MMIDSPNLPSGFRVSAILLAATLISACSSLDLAGLGNAPWLAKADPEIEPASALQEAEPERDVEAAPESTPKPQSAPGRLYEWQGDGRKVTRVLINTDEQKAFFYHGDAQIGWATVATGVSKFPTPTGQFEVIEKKADKRSNLYGKIYNSAGRVVKSDARMGRDAIPAGGRFAGAQMPYFLRLTYDGVGLHAGSIPRPGQPASHGCIRLPKSFAPVLFRHVNHGTPVTIVGNGPSYGNYAEQIRIAARERAAAERAAAEAEAAEEARLTLASGEAPVEAEQAASRQPGNASSRKAGQDAGAQQDTGAPEPSASPSTGEEVVSASAAGPERDLPQGEAVGTGTVREEPSRPSEPAPPVTTADEAATDTPTPVSPVPQPLSDQAALAAPPEPPAAEAIGPSSQEAPATSPAAAERYGP